MVKVAYWAALLTINTSGSGIELRGLRGKNVMIVPPPEDSSIYIPPDSVKNISRPRLIGLNDSARFAAANLLARAFRLGATDGDHFLFPFRIKLVVCRQVNVSSCGHV